jgi:hypothetical protein
MDKYIKSFISTLNALEFEKQKMRRDAIEEFGFPLSKTHADFYRETHLVKRLHNEKVFTLSF